MAVRADVEPTHVSMHVVSPIPPLCSRHGEAEVERRHATIQFHRHNEVRVQTTICSVLWQGWCRLRRVPSSTATELYGEWPLCQRCVRQRRWLRTISAALVAVGLVPMIGLLLGGYLGFLSAPLSPFVALAFMPGWFPALLIAAHAAHERATRYVRVRPIRSDAQVVVLIAHPAFADAFENLSTT